MHVFRPVAVYKSTDYTYHSMEILRGDGEFVVSEMGSQLFTGIKGIAHCTKAFQPGTRWDLA